MRLFLSLLIVSSLCALSSGCKDEESSIRVVDIRGRLVAFPEDMWIVDCLTHDEYWIDPYTIRPWWDSIDVALADAGPDPSSFPPLYIDIRAKIDSNGRFGHNIQLSKAVLEVEEMRLISAEFPAFCSQ